jgi:hypothetical protein
VKLIVFVILISVTALVLIGMFVIVYRKVRDPFHPLVIIIPMFAALYVFLPVKMVYEGTFHGFFSNEELEFVQLINLLGITSLLLGCMASHWKKSLTSQDIFKVSSSVRIRLFGAALVLGSVGVVAYIIEIMNVGGFLGAYGYPYGGGWSDYGYVREAVLLCVPSIVFIFVARIGRRLSLLDIFLLCLFAMPFLIQGFLGARRGPMFMILAAVGLGWYLMRQRRPRLSFLIATGLGLGLFLLFLVSNRDSFYIGSPWEFDAPLSQYLDAGPGNEYIYGAGSILHASITDDYYWGLRYFVTVFVRPIPKQLWPDKYKAFGMDQAENFGTGGQDFLWTLGWAGARGAAPGIIADMWIEAWWFSLLVLFGIGWAYGYAWYSSSTMGGFYTVIYVLMASLTIFLVFQTLEAMLFRFLFMAIPSWFFWRWAILRHNTIPAIAG